MFIGSVRRPAVSVFLGALIIPATVADYSGPSRLPRKLYFTCRQHPVGGLRGIVFRGTMPLGLTWPASQGDSAPLEGNAKFPQWEGFPPSKKVLRWQGTIIQQTCLLNPLHNGLSFPGV